MHDSRITNIHSFTSTPASTVVELAEVDLGLRAGRMVLRDHHLDLVQARARPGGAPTYRDTVTSAHRRAVLGDQPLPDPPGGVPLLARRVLVRDQPAVDHLRATDRSPAAARAGYVFRGGGTARPAPDAPCAGAPLPVRELPDRQSLQPPVPPDLLEQLHP